MADSKIAEMYAELTLRDQKYYAGLNAAHQESVGFVGKLTGTFGQLKGIFAAAAGVSAVAGITSGIQQAIGAASGLNESVSKTQATFHESAGIITGAADEMAAKYGIVKKEFIDGAVNLGLMGKAAGMAAPEAAQLGVKFAKLAADIASFDNIPVEEALMVLRSGLAGESEPLRRFGVLVDENAVKQQAIAMGLSTTGKNLDMQTKTIVRASLIYKGFSDRVGDLERTAGSAANMTRNLQGQWTNMLAEIGTDMLPAVQKVLPAIGELAQEFGEFARDHSAEIKATAEAIGTDLVKSIQDASEYATTFKETWSGIGAWIKEQMKGSGPDPGDFLTAGTIEKFRMAWERGERGSALKGLMFGFEDMPEPEKLTEAEERNKKKFGAARAPAPPPVIFNPPAPAPAIPSPFLDKMREVMGRQQAAQAFAAQLAPGVPGLAIPGLLAPGAAGGGVPFGGLMRPEGMMTPEERLKALQEARGDIERYRPQTQRTSELFTEGGSMEQSFQKSILEHGDKQDEANKLLKEIDKNIKEQNKILEKRAQDKAYALIAPASAARR